MSGKVFSREGPSSLSQLLCQRIHRPPLTAISSSCACALQEIVDIYLACTELDPAHRPTAKELVKRLTAVLQLHKSVTNRPGRSASLSPNPSLQTA